MGRNAFRDLVRFTQGYITEAPVIDDPTDEDANYATSGSQNVLFLGEAKPVPFKGLSVVGGIGSINGLPVGDGIGGLGTKPVADFSLPAIVMANNVCPCVPGYAMSGSELSVFYNGCGSASDGSLDTTGEATAFITNNGILQFKILTPDMIVALRYTVTDCATITSGLDRGFEVQVGAVGTTAIFSARPVSSIESHSTSWVPSDVFMIKLVGNVASFWKNGLLLFTSTLNSTGARLNIFTRVAPAFGKEIRITRFTTATT